MERVKELIIKAQNGDRAALESLVNENAGLIKSVGRRFLHRGLEADDIFQLGAIGLIKCIRKFDLSYDVKLSTYAVPMIAGEIKRFLRDDGQIKVSRSLKELALKAKRTSEAMSKTLGREPTLSEIAKELNVLEEDVVMAMEAAREPDSLDADVFQDGSRGIKAIDKIAHYDETDKIDNRVILKQAIESLDEREREIIRMRYYEDKTQTEVSEKIGVSQVQISRLEKRILRSIRKQYFDIN